MNRTEKEKLVCELKSTFEKSETIVIVKQSGLSVAESTKLRNECRELEVGFRVAKNRLVKIALKGTNFEHLSEHLTGTTAIASSVEPLPATTAVYNFAKKNDKLSIVAGAMGDKKLSADEVKTWGALPSLDELRGKIVGILQAPGGQIARVLASYAEKT